MKNSMGRTTRTLFFIFTKRYEVVAMVKFVVSALAFVFRIASIRISVDELKSKLDVIDSNDDGAIDVVEIISGAISLARYKKKTEKTTK